MPGYLPIDTGSTLHAQQIVEAVINTTFGIAEDLRVETQTAIANAGSSFLDVDSPPEMIAAVVSPAVVTDVEVNIPSTLTAADVITAFDTEQATLVAELASKIADFRDAYFPTEQTTYDGAEQWLQDAIANPDAGIPASVASQLLTDDRDRALSEATRATADMLATFATRGYPLPPGTAAAAAVEIQTKAQGEIAASSRKLAVLSVENMRFAVEKVLSLRQVALTAAADYVKTLAFGMDQAGKVVDGGYGAQARLISAASSYFGAQTSARDLEFKGAMANASMAQEAEKANLQSRLSTIEQRLKSLVTEAETLGRLATAYANNLHATAGTTAGFSETMAT